MDSLSLGRRLHLIRSPATANRSATRVAPIVPIAVSQSGLHQSGTVIAQRLDRPRGPERPGEAAWIRRARSSALEGHQIPVNL